MRLAAAALADTRVRAGLRAAAERMFGTARAYCNLLQVVYPLLRTFCQHNADRYEHLVGCVGWYSN